MDPPVGEVADQNDLCLRVHRANHLCVVADGREAHVQRLCRRVVHHTPVEPKDVGSVTQKQTKVSVILSPLCSTFTNVRH